MCAEMDLPNPSPHHQLRVRVRVGNSGVTFRLLILSIRNPSPDPEPLEGLDMTPYVAVDTDKSNTPMVYDLVGVVNHLGSIDAGHYIAYSRNSHTKKW